MNRIFSMPVTERRVVFAEAAERLQIQTVIVEKDFWVCWMLGRMFGRTEWREALMFKSGSVCTGLSTTDDFFHQGHGQMITKSSAHHHWVLAR